MTIAQGDETKLPESWLRWLARQTPAEVRLRQAGFQAILAGRDVSARDLLRSSATPGWSRRVPAAAGRSASTWCAACRRWARTR